MAGCGVNRTKKAAQGLWGGGTLDHLFLSAPFVAPQALLVQGQSSFAFSAPGWSPLLPNLPGCPTALDLYRLLPSEAGISPWKLTSSSSGPPLMSVGPGLEHKWRLPTAIPQA